MKVVRTWSVEMREERNKTHILALLFTSCNTLLTTSRFRVRGNTRLYTLFPSAVGYRSCTPPHTVHYRHSTPLRVYKEGPHITSRYPTHPRIHPHRHSYDVEYDSLCMHCTPHPLPVL
uniref:Uncharacterized protein n=1 Tax=Trypanosoma vivax (strain Y486) TaxID=1055687 RepID=G0TR89_TRYVY|nr:hypothetical protein, unlikely [Trypanosoma vivax Y486]